MRPVNLSVIFRTLGNILGVETVAFLLCLPVAVYYNEPCRPFVLSATVTFVLAVVLFFFSRGSGINLLTHREGYFSVAAGWLIFSLAGSLPFIVSGTLNNFVDAFFESTSGFTTTGASVIKDVEALPRSVLFWRSLTHWIGGLGIIVLVIIILPSFRITNYSIFTMESSLKEKFHPRTKSLGLRLLYIYLGLTITETVLLYLGEMDLFESVCHTFGTVATGGFSTRNASLAAFSEYSQYIVTVFMFLSGISFVVYYHLIKFNFRKVKNNEELWFYLGVCIIATSIAVSVLFARAGKSMHLAFREGLFQVISIITTTGYSTADYLSWPNAGLLLVFLLFFTGACTGSTTGNIKMARHLIILKNVREIFKKIVHPNAVIQFRLNEKVLDSNLNVSIINFVIIYLFVFLISSAVISLFGMDLLTSVSAAASALGNIGPAFGKLGPLFNYAEVPVIIKVLLSLLMIFGRLELMTIIVLFSPAYWRK